MVEQTNKVLVQKKTTYIKLYDMHKYGLHGWLKSTEGNAHILAEIMLRAAALMKTAEGCLLYMVSTDETDKNMIWITEVWDSKEAHSNSLSVDGVKELISEALPILDGAPQKGQELTVLGGFETD